MITLRLHKPLYMVASYEERFSPQVPYKLDPEAHAWLMEREPNYRMWVRPESWPKDIPARQYLVCYLDLADEDVATLFKLTWM